MTFEELTQITTANSLAIAEINKTQAENNKAIGQLTNAVLSLHESVKSLETTAEVLLESANKHDAAIANLEKQWQAYLTREKRT